MLFVCLLLLGCAQPEERLAEKCAELALPQIGIRPTADLAAVPPAGTDIVMRFRRPGSASDEWVACGFARPAPQGEMLELERMVTSEDGELSPLAVFLLRQYGTAWARGMAPPIAASPLSPLGYALQQVINALTPGGIYALLAAAFALTYAQVGRLHLALGDLGMVGASSGLVLLMAASDGHAPAFGIALVAGGVLLAIATGAAWTGISGAGFMGRLWREAGSTPLIATVALGLALREVVRLVQGARDHWLSPVLTRPVGLEIAPGLDLSIGPAQLLTLSVVSCTGSALALLLGRSRFGRAVRACADDPSMARLLGVDSDRVRLLTFALAGGCASLALTLVLVIYGTLGVEAGFNLGMKALTASIVGGVGSVAGALVGGLLIGLLETFWAAYLGGTYRDLAVFTVLIATLILRPQGLIPRALPEPGDRGRRI